MGPAALVRLSEKLKQKTPSVCVSCETDFTSTFSTIHSGKPFSSTKNSVFFVESSYYVEKLKCMEFQSHCKALYALYRLQTSDFLQLS